MEDRISVRVRIGDQGQTHITVIQWDQSGREIVYREDEQFRGSDRNCEVDFSPANRGQGDVNGKSN